MGTVVRIAVGAGVGIVGIAIGTYYYLKKAKRKALAVINNINTATI